MRLLQSDKFNCLIILVLSLLIISAFVYKENRYTDGCYGAPLDDTFIHLRFAQNISRGFGFSYNEGEPQAGSTSPIWTILVAGVSLITGEYLLTAKVLSACFFILCSFLVYILSKRLGMSKPYALFTSVLLILTGRFDWSILSGIEVTTFTAMLLAMGIIHINGFYILGNLSSIIWSI